jgi:thiamine pyrophosphate-dependent acetolactate synthase large subunit-like protein
MTHREALEVLAACRGRHLVLTTHGSVDLWVSLSDTALDFSYVPASMGQGPALGLGLALAQSRHGVVVVSGDGSLLMNLGCLVTIAANPADLFLLVIDNGVYEVTGGQPYAGAGRTDFAALARASGIRRVYSFDTADAWRVGAAEALAGPGPGRAGAGGGLVEGGGPSGPACADRRATDGGTTRPLAAGHRVLQ